MRGSLGTWHARAMNDDVCSPGSNAPKHAAHDASTSCEACGRVPDVEREYGVPHWLSQGLLLALCKTKTLSAFRKGKGKKAAERIWVRGPDEATLTTMWAEFLVLHEEYNDAMYDAANAFARARLGVELPIKRAR